MVAECFQMPVNIYGDEPKVFSLDLLMLWIKSIYFLKINSICIWNKPQLLLSDWVFNVLSGIFTQFLLLFRIYSNLCNETSRCVWIRNHDVNTIILTRQVCVTKGDAVRYQRNRKDNSLPYSGVI